MRLARFRLVLFIVGPAVLFLLSPAALAALPDVCLSKLLLERECWGCGMTHAFLAVLRGAWSEAYAYNPRVIIAFPLVTFLAARSMLRDIALLRGGSGAAAQALRANHVH